MYIFVCYLKVCCNYFIYLWGSCGALVRSKQEWGSLWLLFNANSTNFQLHHSENKSIFNEMMMRSVLY